MVIRLLTGLVIAYNHTNCVFVSNRKCEIQPMFIILHPSEYSKEFY